jgi:hypothetical protein
LRQIVIHLHPKPGVGAAADRLLEFHGHFRRDPAAARDQIVKLLPRDPEALGGGNNRNFELVERIAGRRLASLWTPVWVAALAFFETAGLYSGISPDLHLLGVYAHKPLAM